MRVASLKAIVRRWRKDESGSVAVETMLMAPLLAWAFLATLTFFDAYRNELISHKAALTIADTISRESSDYITPSYMNGLYGLLKFLTLEDDTPDMRVTVFEWQEGRDRYRRIWSKKRGSRPALNTGDLSSMTGQLPVLADGEIAILVETWTDYDPPWSVGLSAFEMDTYVVISPRFTQQLCWNSTPADATSAVC